VFRLRPDLAIVNTVDFFTPIVDDPFTFGQIAAANALSDVYAMGARPTTALNIVAFPKGTLDLAVLVEIIRGGADRVRAAGALIVGGHSIIDKELKYGLAVTGVVHPDRIVRNVGVKPGDALVLTKPLGTGIITTGLKRRQASRASVRAAVASMVALNDRAATVMSGFPVSACSDVTGFGLLGHAFEMASGSHVSIVLEARSLPLLPGARRLAKLGCLTGGCRRNREYLAPHLSVGRSVAADLAEVAMDPQTSGGLLIAVPEARSEELVAALRQRGMAQAARIGYAIPAAGASVQLV